MARNQFFAGQLSWTNQDLPLFHGTLDIYMPGILAGIDLTRCDRYSDFGQGFYTTTNEDQARSFAIQNVLPLHLRRNPYSPAQAGLIRFIVSREALARLDSLWFVRATPDSSDYWSLIRHFRTASAANILTRTHERVGDQKWYDVAIGPVALSWAARREARRNSDQVSFHTDHGVNLLDASPKQGWVI